MFDEFEGKHGANAASDTGDVKYHLGARTDARRCRRGQVEITLVPNPSHLEFVNPVLEGTARARQRTSPAER